MPKLLSPEEFDAQFGGGYLAEAPRAGLGTRFGASLDRAQAGLYEVGESLGLPLGDLRRENLAESQASRQRYFRDNPDEPQSFRDIDGVGSALRYVRGLAIDSAPELATSLAAWPAGVAMGLGTVGRLGLGAALNAPSALGDVLANQREESGRTNLATAIPLTVPYVAADMLGIEGALARGRMLRTGLKGLDEMQGLKGAAARTAANAGLNFVAEGTGETLQEGVNQLGRMSVNRDQTLFNPEANDRYLESFVGGGLLGAGVSSTLGGWRRTPDQPDQPGQQSVPQFNLLTNPEPLQKRIDQNLGINRRSQKDYAAQFEAAFNEPSGVRVPDAQTGLERELTTGELYQLNMGEQGGESVANTQQVGNTPTNQAQLAAQDALAPQQQAAQRQQEVQQQLQGTAQSLGITPAANISNAWDVLGARVYGQEQVANLVAGVNALQQAKDPEQQQIDAAVLKSNLVNLGGTTNVPSPQKIVNAIAGRLKAFQLEGVSSVARAAEIVNDQIGGLVAAGKNEGDVKLGQLATLYTNLTGQEPPAIKGKSNVSTPSAPAGQPAPASAGGSPDAARSVVNPGPVPVVNEPVRGDAGGAQPAGGQAPVVANATVQRAPAVTTPQVGGAPAPQTEARTTLAVNPSNPFEVLTDEDENALEIAKMTGQEGVAQAIEDEQSGQRVDAEEMAAPEIEALLERRFADSDDPARDRRIFDAFMTATKYAPYGSVGAVKKAVGADFGVGNKLVDKIGNPEELVRVGKQMGFTEQQIEQAFGLDRKRKGKKGVDEEAYAPTDEEPTPSDEELASNDEEAPLTGPRTLGEFIDPDENAGLASDDGPVAADNDMAAALVAQGLDGSSAGLDDSRYWQKASTSGNKGAVPIFQRDATIQGLRDSITQLEAQGLPNAVAQLRTMLEAEQAKLDELLAKLEKPAPAAPKREVAPDLAAAKQKFKSVGRDVTKMEPEELRMLRGEAERFQNTELVKQIDAQLGQAPAVEETAAPAPAAEATPEAPATEPASDRILTAQEKYEAAVAGVPGAPAFDDLPSKAKDRITDLANRDTLDLAAINRIVGEGKQFGKTSTGSGAVDNHYTAAELLSEIKNFVRADIPGRKLFIVDTIGDLLRHPDGKVRAVGAAIALQGAYGVAADGRAFLIADRIAKGRGRAKFMHEVGAHLGLENLLPKALYDKLTQQIIDWAKKEDGSTESELALNAVERVQNAGTPKEDRRKELLAYFIEEAMQAGIDPTASVKESGPLRDWFRTLWAAFKIAVRKLGFKPETMDAQDVVNLAFGAARLEIAGTFHGTAAAFRNFRNKFIGSGEGATAFGWGTYLAQRAGIAKGYWSADVGRKSTSETKWTFQGKTTDEWQRELRGKDDVTDDEQSLRTVIFELNNAQLLGYSGDLALWHAGTQISEKARSASQLKGARYQRAKAWYEDNAREFKSETIKFKPEGSLMRVDVAVDDDKLLDYDKPVIKQSNFVANKLMELLDPVADEVMDMTNTDVEELTGRDLIGTGEQDLGLLSRLIMDDVMSLSPGQDPQFDEAVRQGKFHEAASHFLRANGLDGIKFYDAKSRGTAVQAISFDGRSYNRDDLRDKVREYRNSDPDKAMQFLVLGDVLRNGLDTVMAELEAKVAKQADSFAQVYADSAARYNVKADVAADRARARQEAEDTYSGKQLAWLKANQGDISIAETPRTRNLVVFDDQNVFRVGSAVKADKQRMKFGVESPAKGLVEKNISKLPPQAQKPVRASLATLQDYASKGLDRVVFTGDLIGRAVEAGLKSARTFRDALVARETRARELEREVERIADMYALVPKAEQGDGPGSVNQFLFDSTRLGKWGYDSGSFKADPEMAERFDKLDKKSKAFIKAVFAHGDKMLALKKKTVLDATDSEYDARIADAKARGDAKEQASLENEKKATIKKFQRLFSLREGKPYAPIKRTGNYVVVAKSSTYRDAEANKDTKLLRKLEQDADHYNVTFTDTKGEARALSERLRETGVFGTEPQAVDFFEREDLAKRFSGDSMLNALTKLRSAADARAAAKEPGAARLQTMVSELYLEALAEGSARKSEMRRRGIAGEVDMLRSFAQQGRADSQFLASVQYNGQIQDSIQAMRKEADQFGNRARKTELFNELTNRYQQVLEQKSNPWLDKLTRLSSVWFLATSPGYYMQNLTQPWMMSVPMMAGRFDYAKVTVELVKAYGELKGVLTSGKAFKQSFDLTKVPGDVRDMVQKLVNEGKIDIGLESEMGEFQVEGRGAARDQVNKIDRGLRLAVQKVETINRLSTAIAALRLEKAGGASDAKALEYAAKVLDNTHGDYTAMNAPRFFNTQVGKVALQFRKFQLIQLSYYAKLMNDVATNPAERKAALKTLGYMLGHTMLLAGVRGLPGFAAAAWVLGHLLGDDDEKFDLEGSIRKAIGDSDYANLVMRGAPTLLGADVSGKVGSGNMLSILPFSDADLTTTSGRAEAFGTLIGGASLGLVSRLADGAGLMLSGDWYRGLETMAPKGIGDFAKALREANTGMTRRNGDVLLSPDEISLWETTMQALGVQPVQKAVTYERQQRVKDMDQNFQDRSKAIKNEFVAATRSGDGEARQEAREAWNKLQEARVRNGYTRQPLSELLRAPQQAAKRQRDTIDGVQSNKQNRRFVEQMI